MRKRNLFILVSVLGLLLLLSGTGLSAPPEPSAIQQLERDAVGGLEVVQSATSQYPSFVRGRIILPEVVAFGETDVEIKTLAILDHYGGAFGIGDATRELELTNVQTDELGMEHVTLQQVYKDVDVYNAIIKVHFNASGDEVVAIGNGFVADIDLPSVEPVVTADEAIVLAKEHLPGSTLTGEPELVIFPGAGSQRSGATARLAWMVELRDDAVPARNVYVVDARDSTIQDVLNRLYDGHFSHGGEQDENKPQIESPFPLVLSDGQFPYGPNVGEFDVREFLANHDSPLVQYSEEIDEAAHWYSINPRVLLTMLELHTQLVTNKNNDQQQFHLLNYPDATFEEKLTGLSESLTDAFYRRFYHSAAKDFEVWVHTRDNVRIRLGSEYNAGTYAILSSLAPNSSIEEFEAYTDPNAANGFLAIYRRLFPESDPLDDSNRIDPNEIPADYSLQFPFAVVVFFN